MKKSIKNKIKGTNYTMVKANFSSSPIHNKLSPKKIYSLTPTQIPENADIHDHIKDGNISVAPTSDTVCKLLRVKGFNIINPEYFKNNKLIIPREILKQII